MFFSTCQVLAICSSFEAHATGVGGFDYRWWWALQDFFHFGGGVVLLGVAMFVFCVLTETAARVPQYVRDLLEQVGCPRMRQGCVASLLSAKPLGMHIFRGHLLVDAGRALEYLVVIGAITLNHLVLAFRAVDRKMPEP